MAKKKKETKPRTMAVNPVEKEVDYNGTTVIAKLFEAKVGDETEVFSTRKEASAWVKEQRLAKKGNRVINMISKFLEKITDEKLTDKFQEIATEEVWSDFCDMTELMTKIVGDEE